MGKGGQKKLADFLELSPLQISRMLNNPALKRQTRKIQADEFERIRIFFGESSSVFKQESTAEKKRKFSAGTLERLLDILECCTPEQQEALLTFIEIWGKKPKKS